SNNPLEDDHSEEIFPTKDTCWSFFTVLDGHNGWETSAFLRETMIKSVKDELSKVDPQAQADSQAPVSDPYVDALTRAFKKLDDDIVNGSLERVFSSKSRTAAINLLAPAWAGSCALLAFYDAKSSSLRIALTGDCRAILARKLPNGKYAVEVLTKDQNAWDPAEKARVEAEHPGEEVVKNGRTMGFAPSRVFGDARYKWSREVQTRLKKDFLGRSVLDSVKTPPYFTAEPVVTKVDGIKEGDFLILASDGLPECLSDHEAVGLVGKWINKPELSTAQGGSTSSSIWSSLWPFSSNDAELPVQDPRSAADKAREDATPRHGQWNTEKKFITIDSNAATHLIRNCLGGGDQDLLKAILSIQSPRARIYRDDITTTVVFFGKS
ncbi:hypothetical protein M422DRAFT_185373, partial [Sphaerobolus stellatus SS14]